MTGAQVDKKGRQTPDILSPFQQSWAQMAVDFDGAADDAVGEVGGWVHDLGAPRTG